MISTLMLKIKGFLVNPSETFRQSKNDEAGPVFTYLAALLLVNAVLSAIIAATIGSMDMVPGMDFGVALPVMVFFMILVGGFITTLIFAAWLHLWVYIFGGRKGIMQTITAVIYGSTPRLLFGWIPFIGFLFTLWSLFLAVLGIRELQDLSDTKAVLAVAVAVMIPIIVIILLAAYFFIAYSTVSPVPVVTEVLSTG